MMVLSNANVIIEYDGRRSGLPSAPLDMEYDNYSIEQKFFKHTTYITQHAIPNIQHTTYNISILWQDNHILEGGVGTTAVRHCWSGRGIAETRRVSVFPHVCRVLVHLEEPVRHVQRQVGHFETHCG